MATVIGSCRPQVLLLGLLLGLLPGVASGGEPVPPPSASWGISLHGDDLSVHADRAPLWLMLVEIARQGGFRVQLSETAAQGVVSAHFERLPFLEGLDRLLVGWPYAVIQTPAARGSRSDTLPRIVELLVLSPAASDSGHALTVFAPDPQARIAALEEWAVQREGPGVDPLTYALVDPDEGVRTRAQELFEEALTQ